MANAPPHRRPFDITPPEIIALILDGLLAPPPELGETCSVTYNELTPDMPWFDFIRSRRGLYSMCLVSHRLSLLARPLLYRVVPLRNGEEMLLFFHTLLGNPQFGHFTRNVACHITLTAPSVIENFQHLLNKILGDVLTTTAVHMVNDDLLRPASDTSVLTTAALHMLSMLRNFLSDQMRVRRILEKLSPFLPRQCVLGNFKYVPQVVFCYVLMHLTMVDTVLLQIPCGDERKYTILCTEIETIECMFQKERFQHIHTLLLQGDPNIPATSDIDEWGCQPHHYTQLFASFPNLTTLRVSSDLGVWDHATLPPNLRHVYLYDSGASPGDLGNLLRNAPQLETLSMTPNCGTCYIYHDAPDFGIQLTNHTNLWHLNVRWKSLDSDRPTSLAEMQSLRFLHIQMFMLYGAKPLALETPLIDLLPPNLVQLTVDEWEPASSKPHAMNILTQFARDVRKRLHGLKKVVLRCEIPCIWEQEGDVKTMFLDQGVDFSVELDKFSRVEEWGGAIN